MKKIELPNFVRPKEPTTPLTQEQKNALHRFYPEHSYSNVGADGRIILGGGEEPSGKFYTTPEILEAAIHLENIVKIARRKQ